MHRVLIIRFSSFGDIVQCMAALPALKERFPDSQIDFVTRSEFASLVSCAPEVQQIWSLKRGTGLKGLLQLAKQLKARRYDRIYDAHRSLRSFLLRLLLLGPLAAFFPKLSAGQRFVSRDKERWKRLLLFSFPIAKINLFPKPYRGMLSYLAPLKRWGCRTNIARPARWHFPPALTQSLGQALGSGPDNFVALAPSAAWEKKRWPLEHFKTLVRALPEIRFVVLGGPQDAFCAEIEALDPSRIINLAGRLSLIESCALVAQCRLLVSADTGLLHVADLLGTKGIALQGPTAFGHTSGQWIKEMGVDLPCRPCSKDGRGGCVQSTYQQCMVDIRPERVANAVLELY